MSQESFRAFGSYGHTEAETSRSWFSSLAASSVIYVAIALGVLSIPVTQRIVERRKEVEIKFVEKVVKPPPPPPPVEAPKIEPPKPAVAKPAPAPAAAAPIVRPDQKIRRLDKPPPPKKLVVPKEMPLEAPKEADPSLDKGIAVYGDGTTGDVAGLEGGIAGGVAGGEVGGGGGIPEDADPPVPARGNVKPTYPQQAIASKQTGMVVLKVLILADGSVTDVQVLKGEEPFVSAAVEAVKRWKYEPARYKGQPITVFRVIHVPFKLTA
jgi:periplasmic protein TonB